MIRTMTLATIAAALTIPARAQAQAPVPLGDEYFAMKAYADGLAEVAKSRLALERSSSPEVRKFSEQMVKEHTEVNNKIVALAAGKRIALPAAIDAVHAAAAARLAQLSGSEFDKEYMKAQIGAHKEALHLFGHEAHKGEDPELKALAEKTLPHLEEHTKMAFEVAGERREYAKHLKIEAHKKQVMAEK